MEFIADILIWLAVSMLGATVGVIWPAKTPEWATWQMWGIASGVISLLCFGTAYAVCQLTDRSPMFWPAITIGFVALIGYCLIGNICRHFHEKQ